jgi:hypothetical protein
LVVIPDNGIDVEEESRLYDELCEVTYPFSFIMSYYFLISRLQDSISQGSATHTRKRPSSPNGPPSVFSNDIYLGDNSGESLAFARDVKIGGWTSVGDKLGGAYIGK